LQNIHGTWSPKSLFSGKELLVIGSGLSARQHKGEIERYIRAQRPLVIALNKQKVIDSDLVGLRAACHPMRLLADYKQLINFSEPLVIPGAFLPESISSLMKNKSIFDFGLEVSDEGFEFLEYSCRVPSMLVAAYVLAMAASGNASRVLLAGFDGFGSDDPRTSEMENMLTQYMATPNSCQLISITPTYYSVPQTSVYGMGAYD